jgi:ribonuclease BN (tRNA processing enzyme)
MKVKILGCSGSETKGHLPPGILVNDTVMLDAGTITAALDLAGQSRITDVFISHPHLDHLKSLPFLADNVIGTINKPVRIRSIEPVLDALRAHIFNNVIWPDFTRIPLVRNQKLPVLEYAAIPIGTAVKAGGLSITALPMTHPVPAVGFQVSDGKSTFIYSADTGPNELLWKYAAKAKNLSAIIVDTSFPNSLDGIARLSGHFTPAQLSDDLAKAQIDPRIALYIYHVKPAYEKKVLAELKTLGRKRVSILQEGKTYNF